MEICFKRNESFPLQSWVSIEDARIESVEKGNCDDPTAKRPVCAITVMKNGRRVKALLKGSVAMVAYNNFLAGFPFVETCNEGDCVIEQTILVSLFGLIREIRTSYDNEVVLDCINDIHFSVYTSIGLRDEE